MKNIRTIHWLPAVYALLVYTSLRLVNDVISETRFWLRPLHTNVIEIVVSVITSYITLFVLRKMLTRQQQRMIPLPVWKEYGMVALVITAISYITIIPMAALTDDGCQWYDIVNITLIPLLYGLLAYAILRASASLRKNYEQQLLLEKISNDKLQTELQFLKAQFHPHFLFNALNMIYFQMDESVKVAKHTVEQLSELLRYQLYDQQQLVPVGKELQYLQSYIDLQQQRMNSHLQLTVSFDPQLQQQNVYPLLLLPLVENAFKYTGGDYWINIAATLQEQDLLFHVSNAVPDSQRIKSGGIGLENLRRRLELLYPGQHELTTTHNGNNYTAILKLNL
ncbi:sensor histidine kinase [Chitinophaga sp. sic0106]|uniref:sensor histidine kinase n=1 Tax=Chitinophaga sp. sic0106 TaxID=2854785 RepID=UPI001C4826C8|nr:sensor histidine kinase [Chitinophaga sp. sic0106]MBV7531732.1 histidine kinase [Chitinophaga sp. sic0106]